MGAPYNLGYLTGASARVKICGRVLRSLPSCPYPDGSKLACCWINGMLDAIADRLVTA